jgi:uncharacterized protein
MSELEAVAPSAPEVPPPPAQPLAPVAAGERIEIIDVVRGMALFGILAANIRGFAGPAITYFAPHLFWPAPADRWAQAFVDAFIQGKFITIFATLFGVGFGVQVDRALRRGGTSFNWTWARRCAVLLLFGLVHGLLIWFGDILLVYASVGFFLLLFKKRQDKTLIRWAIISACVPVLLMVTVFIASQFGHGPSGGPKTPTAAEIAHQRDVFSHGTWMQVEAERASDAVNDNWKYLPFMFWHILSLFLAGLILWRKGFFQPTPESLPRYRKLAAIAVPLGIVGNVALVAIRWVLSPAMMPTNPMAFAVGLLSAVSVPLLSLGYITLIVLLLHSARWHALVARFAYIGRTAFSNYLLQSIVGTLVFYSYGLGLFGQVGPAVLLPATVVFFALQVVLSRWWLERYRFGPMEWVWRRLTYRSPLPMRRGGAGALAPAAP